MAAVLHMVHSSVPSSSPHGTSAPVIEYVCLFTHDLRRKQKRWQDGRLKLHTFNGRIMVYDERGNFVGDTHWREDYDFGEGEEFDLERGNTIVQAGECVGSRQQDLTEIVDKRIQEKAERQAERRAAAAARQPSIRPVPALSITHSRLHQLPPRHRPLLQLIGTPTGHHGRAYVPPESPFEERQRANAQEPDESLQPAKRRKREASPPSKNGYAQSLFGASLTLSGMSMSSAPIRQRPRKVVQVPSSDVSSRDKDDENDNIRELDPPIEEPHVREVLLPGRSTTSVNMLRISSGETSTKNARPKAYTFEGMESNRDTHARPSSRSKSGQPPHRTLAPLTLVPKTDDNVSRGLGSEASRADGEHRQRPEEAQPRNTSTTSDLPENDNGLASFKEVSRDSLKRLLSKRLGRQEESGSPSAKLSNAKQPVNKPVTAYERRTEQVQTLGKPNTATKDVSKPGQSFDKPVMVDEPTTELRINPRKKRGLLMMSEQGLTKRSRKSSNADTGSTAGNTGASPKTIASNDGDSTVSSDSRAEFRQRDCDKPGRIHHRPREDGRFCRSDGTSEVNPRLNRSRSDREVLVAQPSAQPQLDEESLTERDSANPAARCGRGSRARQTQTASRVPAGRRLEAQNIGSSEDTFEEKPPQTRKPERDKRRAGTSRASQCNSNQADSLKLCDPQEQPRIERTRHSEADLLEARFEPRPRKGHREDSNGENANKPDMPPPRLAPLRKSIRSKEVIGFISEDDEPLTIATSQANTQVAPRFPERSQQTSTTVEEPAFQETTTEKQPRQSPVTVKESRILEDNTEQPHQKSCTSPQPVIPEVVCEQPQQESFAVPKATLPEVQDKQLQQTSFVATTGKTIKDGNERLQQSAPAFEKPTKPEAEGIHRIPAAAPRPSKTSGDRRPNPTATSDISENQTEESLAQGNDGKGLPCPDEPHLARHGNHRAASGPTCNITHGPSPPPPAFLGTKRLHSAPAKPNMRREAVKASNQIQPPLTQDNGVDRTKETQRITVGLSAEMAALNRQSVPRLVNPATRGRKAAKPSDAVGQVPEGVLLPSGGASYTTMRQPSRALPRDAVDHVKEALAMPGFSKANGGPWSREAHDLFEFTHPK